MNVRNPRTNRYPREWEYVPQIENRYPDQPDNLQFCELPEITQARIDTRFQVGICLCEMRSKVQRNLARSAGHELARRCVAARVKREAVKAADRVMRAEVLDKARRRVRS